MKTATSPARVARAYLGRGRACLLAAALVCVFHAARADGSSDDSELPKAADPAPVAHPKPVATAGQEPLASRPRDAAGSASQAATVAVKQVSPAVLAVARERALPAGKVIITGSRIPHAIKKHRILITSSPVVTIDRQRIRRSAAQTPADLFGRFPPNR